MKNENDEHLHPEIDKMSDEPQINQGNIEVEYGSENKELDNQVQEIESKEAPQTQQSDMRDNKNSTLEKIKFYVKFIGGGLIIIIVLFSMLKSILGGSTEDKKVVEAEAPQVQELKKDNFLSMLKEDSVDLSAPVPIAEATKKPTKEKEPSFDEQMNIFNASVIATKPPKPKIVKGAVGALVNSNNNGGGGGGTSKYDNQIKELEAEREKILSMQNNPDSPKASSDYDGDVFTPATVRMNEFNPDLLLPKGSYIGCSLDTRFVSSIGGSTSCTVSQNIYSANGNVLLIEKGSKIFGTYKGEETGDASSRYFVIWQEIRTPNHLRIPVSSGASDELGGAGLEGEIDHKWMMRFGSSILLSAIDDMWNVLAWKITNTNPENSNTNNIDYSQNSRENAKQMSAIALEKFINIKPTIYKQHGDLVGVYVNRDIDFSKVYKISRKK